MQRIVARGVIFGMAVAYMISTEQRSIETVASMRRVNTPLTTENEGQISRVSAHRVLDMRYGDI